MAETSIEWADWVWNVLRGCSEISPGCLHCYAALTAWRFAGPGMPYEGLVKKLDNGKVVWTGRLREVPEKLDEPFRWRKPRKVFVNSMSDLFHEDVSDDFIAAVFAVMGAAPQHIFQVLTKRAGRMRDWLARASEDPAATLSRGIGSQFWGDDFACNIANYVNGWSRWRRMPDDGNPLDGTVPRWPLPNVWLGVSVEDQPRADERIPLLFQVPAAVRFLSIEPLLGPVDIYKYLFDPYPHREHWPHEKRDKLHWVIVGGESGHGARPMHPDWARSIRDQCVAAGVPYLFKQWGEWGISGQCPDDGAGLRIRESHWLTPDGELVRTVTSASGRWANILRVGKEASGRLLDGREWNEFPTVASEAEVFQP